MLAAVITLWLTFSAIAAVYAYWQPPKGHHAGVVRRPVFFINTVACVWAAVGVIGGFPFGWYAAVLHAAIDTVESFWPDAAEKSRPRWAAIVNVTYGLLSAAMISLLMTSGARHAFRAE